MRAAGSGGAGARLDGDVRARRLALNAIAPPLPGRPASAAQTLRAQLVRWRGRPDSEHEMGFNRMVIGSAALLYAWQVGHSPLDVLVPAVYLVAAVFVLLVIARDTQVRPARRVAMMLLDFTASGVIMQADGAQAAVFYPLYLWVILGNGFRFGVRYLHIATAMGATSFLLIVMTTPFWRALPSLSAGLMFGLVALPLYCATLIRKLSTATRQAEEANRAKSYFLASVSHELRTPLTAIIGLGAHLQQSEVDEERRQTTGTIVAAGRSLLSMINRLLDYSRFEAEGGHVAQERFDVPALLRGVRDLLVFNAQEKGLLLGVTIQPGTPMALIGDMPHLRDVLVNLVGNAVKFTERGAITIAAEAQPLAGARMMLRLSVADTGIGIAPDAQEHIFGSFRQADDTIIDRFGGTGLGLAICKQLATLLGGEIGVDSEPGRGSTFWFTALVERAESDAAADAGADAANGLPQLVLLAAEDAEPPLLANSGADVTRLSDEAAFVQAIKAAPGSIAMIDARMLASEDIVARLGALLGRGIAPILIGDPPASRAAMALFVTAVPMDATPAQLAAALAIAAALGDRAAAPEADAGGKPRRGMRILLADDNAMNQKVLGMILRRAGHDVTGVVDGEAALDRMKDHSFDVVLMDVNMPVLNGIEATKLYRFAALGQRRVPIVGVTADASPATATRCRDAGMDACIEKPVEADELLDLIDRLAGIEAAAAVAAPVVPAFDPAGVVTPLFPPAEPDTGPPAIDWGSLEELDELGGRAFVAELIDVYQADAAGLLVDIRAAVAAGDLAAFRTGTHAFRSSAANVGAIRVAELCLHYQRISEPEFAARGRAHVMTLERELARVVAALGERDDWVRAAAG